MDIDKAYMMGFEMGDDGRIVKYSDLFDYSTEETLKASLYLPTPNGISFQIKSGGYDITLQLAEIAPIASELQSIEAKLLTNPILKAKYLRLLADLLIDILDNGKIYTAENGLQRIDISYDSNIVNSFGANVAISAMQKHEYTEISPLLSLLAYKVSIAASIGNIVLNIRNMDQAYSPIEMGDLQDASSKSKKGALTQRMSLMNPLTSILMLVQNMVGKKVIGITAVGEKVFFNGSFYWNEGLRSGNPNWLRNLRFERTFNRIEGRAKNFISVNGRYFGQINSVTKNRIANANFEYAELYKELFENVTDVATEVRQSEFKDYTDELLLLPDLHLKFEDRIKQVFNERFSNLKEADLMISQVLSAATDNAKELILSKINCGENLAKCYLHLIMMGFDIKDIVAFMTSPVVEAVNAFSESNMFDAYVPELTVDLAVDILNGTLLCDQFFYGTNRYTNEETGEASVESNATTMAGILKGKLKGIIPEIDKVKRNLQEVTKKFIEYRLTNPESELTLGSFDLKNPELQIFSDYVENIIQRVKQVKSLYANEEDFNADLEELKLVLQLADETSSFGGTMLGMNLGLPTDKVGLQSKLNSILRIVEKRELIFGLSYNHVLFSDPKKVNDHLYTIADQLIANNPTLDREYIINTLIKADALGIINNFDIEKWLYNSPISINLEKNLYRPVITGETTLSGKPKYDVKVITNEDVPSTTYRQIVADYYNIVRGTWNIFDAMDKIPLYKSILDLLKVEYTVDKHTSTKSNLINRISDDFKDRSGYIDDKMTRRILKYTDDLLINNFLLTRPNPFNFPVPDGSKYFTPFIETKIANTNNYVVNLATAEGRATFKRLMETEVIPSLLTTGRWNGYYYGDYKENAFLLNLSVDYDTNGQSYLSTDLDMMLINSTPNTLRKYLLYLNGLNDLASIKINGTSLLDWIVLYNMITNQNLYGSDRLTKLLENIIKYNPKSVINTYYKYLGDLDYEKTPEELLETLGYNFEDVALRTAVSKSEYLSKSAKEICIRIRKPNGLYDYKMKNRYNKYVPISIYPQRDLTLNSDRNVKELTRADYIKYWTMPMKNAAFLSALRTGLLSGNIEDVIKTLQIYTKQGIIKLYLENC